MINVCCGSFTFDGLGCDDETDRSVLCCVLSFALKARLCLRIVLLLLSLDLNKVTRFLCSNAEAFCLWLTVVEAITILVIFAGHLIVVGGSDVDSPCQAGMGWAPY